MYYYYSLAWIFYFSFLLLLLLFTSIKFVLSKSSITDEYCGLTWVAVCLVVELPSMSRPCTSPARVPRSVQVIVLLILACVTLLLSGSCSDSDTGVLFA